MVRPRVLLCWGQAACLVALTARATFTLLRAGHGEELQARRLKARLRWARLRTSLAAVISLRAAAQPLRPPRIVGPWRIRTAFLQRQAVGQAMAQLEGASLPPTPPTQPTTRSASIAVQPGILAAAAAAAAAELESGGEGDQDATRDGARSFDFGTVPAAAAWVDAVSPRWIARRGDSFNFSPHGPGLSRSAPG